MKHAIWIALLFWAGLLPAMAQRASGGSFGGGGIGALPTGGLGVSSGFGAGAVPVPGTHLGGGIHLGRFPRHHFDHNQIFVFGYPGFYGYGYDEPYQPIVVYENPPRQNSLPQPQQPAYEGHVSLPPLIIEKVGNDWVRRQVVEAGVETQPQLREQGEQTSPARPRRAKPSCQLPVASCRPEGTVQ